MAPDLPMEGDDTPAGHTPQSRLWPCMYTTG
jgi:hypothetical protein